MNAIETTAAEIAKLTQIDAAKLLLHEACRLEDAHEPFSDMAAKAKLFGQAVISHLGNVDVPFETWSRRTYPFPRLS